MGSTVLESDNLPNSQATLWIKYRSITLLTWLHYPIRSWSFTNSSFHKLSRVPGITVLGVRRMLTVKRQCEELE